MLKFNFFFLPLCEKRGAAVVVGGGLLGFLILIPILGYYGAIPLFLIYYIRFLGKHSWAATLSISIGIPVIIFWATFLKTGAATSPP